MSFLGLFTFTAAYLPWVSELQLSIILPFHTILFLYTVCSTFLVVVSLFRNLVEIRLLCQNPEFVCGDSLNLFYESCNYLKLASFKKFKKFSPTDHSFPEVSSPGIGKRVRKA